MRRLAQFVVVALGLLALAGADRGGTYQGGTYSTAGATYQAGGVAAGWDTATVLFSPEARVVTAIDLVNYPQNPAGVDTFALPASASAADIARIVKLNSQLLGRDGTIYSFRDGPSDSARVLRLGTGFDVPEFAYADIDTGWPLGYKEATGYTIGMNSDKRVTLSGGAYLSMQFAVDYSGAAADTIGRRASLFYLPFEDHIPAGVTIIDAYGDMSVAGNFYMGYPDSISATLMTNQNDSWWYTAKGITNYPDYAKTCWRRQHSGKTSWGGTPAHPWVPELNARSRFWDWGRVSDWTGSAYDFPAYIPTQTSYKLSLVNCVQSAVNGAVNNGIIINYMNDALSTCETIRFHAWDDYSTALRRTPVVVVKYITKPYRKAFGSADWAFVFQSDDGRNVANRLWADTLETYGGKMTMYIAEVQVGTAGVNDATRGFTIEELLEMHGRGHEIGSHSKTHKGAVGYQKRIIATGSPPAPGTGIASVHYDSMRVDYGPGWLLAAADSLGRDMTDDPMWAKSFGAPTSQLNAFSQRVLIDHNYKSYRGLWTGGTRDTEKFYAPPSPAYGANGDSLYSGAPRSYERHVRNMRQIAPWDGATNLFGYLANTYANAGHIDSVTTSMKRLVYTRIGNQTRVVCTFGHDLKTGSTGGYPGEGIDAEELGAAARVVVAWGGRFMTSGELGDWYAATSEAIAYPFANARTDTFQIDASDDVWGKPHGVDQRWIRGVK